MHVMRKQGMGGRLALGEGRGGAPLQGRGGIVDGLTGGRAWLVGTESRSSGVVELGGGGGDQQLRRGLGVTMVGPMDGARRRQPHSA
jgi:hypothetical protein